MFEDLTIFGTPLIAIFILLKKYWVNISSTFNSLLKLKFAAEFAELDSLRKKNIELEKYKVKYDVYKEDLIKSEITNKFISKKNEELELEAKRDSISNDDYLKEKKQINEKYK